MSLDRCLELIEERFDRERDLEALFEELAELEAETLENGASEKYHEPLGKFLVRMDELFNEEYDESLVLSTVANLRQELETIKAAQVPEDPLEHLFFDMMRYECGTVPSSTALATLSRYETLLLALRDQFEQTTDPTDEREVCQMMRQGLDILEAASKRLRQDLANELDYAFDEIRAEFNEGTDILVTFRRKANFVGGDEESE